MKNKRIDLGSATEDTLKGVRSLLGKAKDTIIKTVDQNNDGSFDLKDVSALAGTIGNVAKNTAGAVKNTVEERTREKELNALKPLFADDINKDSFSLTKLICITDIDKKHADSILCAGSIGHISEPKELRVINIYRDHSAHFGLELIPDDECELYYVDPIDKNKYIALDRYFRYMKEACINELEKIAQDLGAKHFRVLFKEDKSSSTENIVKAKQDIKAIVKSASGEEEKYRAASASSSFELSAEMDCPGHAPVMPKLHYLQNEPNIQNLIALRMDKNSAPTRLVYRIYLSNSTGIKSHDAAKIDAAIKVMKASINTSVVGEVQKESESYFEYEIDF